MCLWCSLFGCRCCFVVSVDVDCVWSVCCYLCCILSVDCAWLLVTVVDVWSSLSFVLFADCSVCSYRCRVVCLCFIRCCRWCVAIWRSVVLRLFVVWCVVVVLTVLFCICCLWGCLLWLFGCMFAFLKLWFVCASTMRVCWCVCHWFAAVVVAFMYAASAPKGFGHGIWLWLSCFIWLFLICCCSQNGSTGLPTTSHFPI